MRRQNALGEKLFEYPISANVEQMLPTSGRTRMYYCPEDSLYKAMYKTPGPQEGDINTMHRYRDAIVAESGASSYERTMFGAYVLFPYHNEGEYRNHKFYQSIDKVNIGGLPFLPSATTLVTDMLDQLVADSPDSAFERATLPIGIEERLDMSEK